MGEAQPLIFDIEEESIDDLLQDSPKTEETDVETDNEDEVKVIPTLVSPYTYINDQLRKTEDHEDIITLNPDFDELGVYRLANTTFRSHVHYCLGAVLYMGKSFVMWIDWPLALVKKHTRKNKTRRTYWNKHAERPYSYFHDDNGTYFGLSPGIQELTITNSESLEKYGLMLKEDSFPFTGYRQVRYLEINIDKVNEKKEAIIEWLDIREEEDEKRQTKKLENLLANLLTTIDRKFKM